MTPALWFLTAIWTILLITFEIQHCRDRKRDRRTRDRLRRSAALQAHERGRAPYPGVQARPYSYGQDEQAWRELHLDESALARTWLEIHRLPETREPA